MPGQEGDLARLDPELRPARPTRSAAVGAKAPGRARFGGAVREVEVDLLAAVVGEHEQTGGMRAVAEGCESARKGLLRALGDALGADEGGVAVFGHCFTRVLIYVRFRSG